MKKSILILAIGLISAASTFAQSKNLKPDTAKKTAVAAPAPAQPVAPKPQYQADPNRTYNIVLTGLRGYQVAALTGSLDGSLEKNPNLNGQGIEDMKDEAKYLKHVVLEEVNIQDNMAYQKFVSDTSRVSGPDTVAGKKPKPKHPKS